MEVERTFTAVTARAKAEEKEFYDFFPSSLNVHIQCENHPVQQTAHSERSYDNSK